MELLVVRHAIAEDREAFAKGGEDDAARPLTAAGRRRFRRGARGLREVVERIDVLATSELVRAVETGDLLAEAFPGLRPVRLKELAPGADPAALLRWLRRQRPRAVVAVVGHEPHLSTVVAWLLAGLRRPALLDLEKGGAGLLAFTGSPRAGGAELRWLLTAGQLRRLA